MTHNSRKKAIVSKINVKSQQTFLSDCKYFKLCGPYCLSYNCISLCCGANAAIDNT